MLRSAARLSALSLPIALTATPLPAQTRHDEAVWVNVTAMGSIKDRLVYFAEVQPRVTDGASRVSAILLRPAIGWKFSDAVTVYQGYARVIEPLDGRDRHEDRLFQQVTWNVGSIGRLEVQSRSRLEQRWRSDGPGVSLRARQMLRFEFPLAPGKRRVAALGWSEAFVGLKSARWGGVEGFDQLRTFAGVEGPLEGASTLELGYLNQTRDAPGRRVEMAHVASVTAFLRF
jgi:hypothetical protein